MYLHAKGSACIILNAILADEINGGEKVNLKSERSATYEIRCGFFSKKRKPHHHYLGTDQGYKGEKVFCCRSFKNGIFNCAKQKGER